MEFDLVPNQVSWSNLINAVVKQKDSNNKFSVEKGLEILNRLENSGVLVTIAMFNTVLKGMVENNDSETQVMDFWMRMHATPAISLDSIAFSIYLRHCKLTSQIERAFFAMDEMKLLEVEQTTYVFRHFFRSCAESPFWVKGYEDTIIDAMRMMEGQELMPDSDIYNAVIYAFARSCDAKAAEFYFWEMRRKGLEQDTETYNALLNALARSQTVGAARYGSKVVIFV
jgi:pentatricopeptide repeat protein